VTPKLSSSFFGSSSPPLPPPPPFRESFAGPFYSSAPSGHFPLFPTFSPYFSTLPPDLTCFSRSYYLTFFSFILRRPASAPPSVFMRMRCFRRPYSLRPSARSDSTFHCHPSLVRNDLFAHSVLRILSFSPEWCRVFNGILRVPICAFRGPPYDETPSACFRFLV